MKDRTRKCLDWLKKEHDITGLSIGNIVELVINWAEMNVSDSMYKRIKANLEADEKQKQLEATRDDYNTEVDDKGRVWYVLAHGHKQRPESRKLKIGDIIKYEATCPDNGYEKGFMVIDSFDYENDFMARSYISLSTDIFRDRYTGAKTVYESSFGCGGAPGMYKFTFATDDETEAFFSEMKQKHFENYLLHCKSDITPDYIKERYGKYLEGGDTWEDWKKNKS